MSNNKELIFGLDIGTRTVVGTVGYEENGKFIVMAMEECEHDSRSMVDGQIHNVGEVAKAVEKVKNNLEAKLDGIKLRNVAIAAAGRSLRTYTVKVEQNIDSRMITSKDIRLLEFNGVRKAEEKLVEELNDDTLEYFCVAHTVVNYYLDGYTIADLESHRGKNIGAEVIATFLPKAVVDSLYAVVDKVGLNVITLTLEPIAAINVAIPQKLRLLNLCLIDIGAGTSDIAITKDGSVVAYGMIPFAGDELTEKIVHKYLVDFDTAEKIKRGIEGNDKISFADILGTPQEIKKSDVLETINETLEKLALEIANKIKELNKDKTPNAVFCVGGGGQVEGFTKMLAKKLEIPAERVALRSSNLIEDVEYLNEAIEGSNMVTPIGICMTSIATSGYNFIEVKINGENIRLLNTRKLKVLDVAITKEFSHENLIGRKGKDLEFKLNGNPKKIRGEFGEQAVILLNDKTADLETEIHEGDIIKIKPAHKGKDAKVFIEDVIDKDEIITITFNDDIIELSPRAILNGNEESLEIELKKDDDLEIIRIDTIRKLFSDISYKYENEEILINGIKSNLDSDIIDGDYIQVERKEISTKEKTEKNIEKNSKKKYNGINVKLNGEKITLDKSEDSCMFVDLFNYIDVDVNDTKGILKMEINGFKAALTDPIKNGDIVKIEWTN